MCTVAVLHRSIGPKVDTLSHGWWVCFSPCLHPALSPWLLLIICMTACGPLRGKRSTLWTTKLKAWTCCRHRDDGSGLWSWLQLVVAQGRCYPDKTTTCWEPISKQWDKGVSDFDLMTKFLWYTLYPSALSWLLEFNSGEIPTRLNDSDLNCWTKLMGNICQCLHPLLQEHLVFLLRPMLFTFSLWSTHFCNFSKETKPQVVQLFPPNISINRFYHLI